MAKKAKAKSKKTKGAGTARKRAKDQEYVLRTVKEQNVRFIRLWFTDILGFLKSFAIMPSELETALEEGMGFDGSSIEGFARIDESDMLAKPDPATFQILPWRTTEEGNTARMFCDILNPDGSHYAGDPRYCLKRNLRKAADKGFTFYVGPELEYFYFKNPEPPPVVLDKGGYFDLTPLDVATDFRRKTVVILEKMGIPVEYSHHEVGPSQHEIDLRYSDALTMADSATTYRLIVKEVALQNGIHATFMPKPLFGENGSGMHVHQSLFKGDRNAFYSPRDRYNLSNTCKYYIAGLMKHAQETTLVMNQWVNSYKRLVPGYEAPVYISWAMRNRADMIRVPMYKPGKESATRIEFRSPDPACNLHLAFAVMLAAGLKGIEKKYKLPEPVEENVYEMSEEERKRRGIDTLPESLGRAITAAEGSELLREALGDHIFTKLIAGKKIEWARYKAQVTSYELEEYMPVL